MNRTQEAMLNQAKAKLDEAKLFIIGAAGLSTDHNLACSLASNTKEIEKAIAGIDKHLCD